MLSDGEHGALFRAGDVADCARALARVVAGGFSNPAACLALASRYSAAAERDQWCDLIDAVAAPLAATEQKVSRIP